MRCWSSRLDGHLHKEAYRLRKQLVEPVFGQRARWHGGSLRGLVNVAAEWTMLATAFNLRTAFIQLPQAS